MRCAAAAVKGQPGRACVGRSNQLAWAVSVFAAPPILTTAASARPPTVHRPGPGARLYGGLILVVAVVLLSAWFAPYPLDRRIAGALLGLYGAILIARPTAWLVLLPALWPVADLAPWGGHIHFTESDALALTTLAALGLREAFAPPPATLAGRAPLKLRAGALGLFGLLALSVALSGLHGLLPLPAADAASLVGYNSTLNALRIGKGFLFAFALIPFLHLAVRRDGEAALDRFGLGLTLGLGTCAAAALWERVAFPGFTNFASDYRTTALFWEMHVGGAALDAWLMLSFPFALLGLRRARGPLARTLTLLIVAIGLYALFTTFSRIVYGALLVMLAVLGLASLGRPTATAGDTPRRHPVRLAALVAALLAGGVLTFPEGGYRALLAFTGTALLAWPAGTALAGMRPARFALGLAGSLVLAVVVAGAALNLPKGVYLGYAGLWASAALALGLRRRGAAIGGAVFVALLGGLAWSTVLVSAFWSEPLRFAGTLGGAVLLIVVLARQALGRTPLWQPRGRDVQGLVTVLAVGGMLVTTLGGYYMGSRLANTAADAGTRFQHTERSLSLMQGGLDALLGIGLGRFPEAYFWHVADPATPGSLSLLGDAGSRYMRLGGPRQPRSIDEVVLLTQRLPMDATTPLHYRFKARSQSDTQLMLAVCRKHLLYAAPCTYSLVPIRGSGEWQQIAGSFAEPLAPPAWPPQITVFTAGLTTATPVDLDDIELIDGQLRPLVSNGDFERGGDFWFFSSDRDHLPWHAKNLFVHAYIEQGTLGGAAVLLLLAAALLHLARRPTRLQPHAPTLLAALAGVTTVGMVDSLLDMPRITVMLLLLLWLGLNLRQPPAR